MISVMTASPSTASFIPERNMDLKTPDLAPRTALWTLKLLLATFRVKSAVSGSSLSFVMSSMKTWVSFFNDLFMTNSLSTNTLTRV